jgi:hypothetical protein
MAPPSAAQDNLSKPDRDSSAPNAQDNKLPTLISDFFAGYQPPGNNAGDVLDGRFRVDFNHPVPAYNTQTATAYHAEDLVEGNSNLYALVCKPGTYQRHTAIKKLLNFEHKHFVMLKAAGVLMNPLNSTEQFVLIYTRPVGQKLSELMAGVSGRISESFISRNILSPLITVVGQLAEMGMTHGAIRPDNIYYGEYPMLGECLSEPSGFSQPFYFDPIYRMQAHPAAKGEGRIEHDYYALAILTIYMLYGPSHFSGYTTESLQKKILKDGAYAALMRGKEPPEMFTDLLRGLLSGNINERWNYRNLKQWLDSKRSNIMLPSAPTESARPFEFGGASISSRAELAHYLFLNWNQAIELMRTDRLIQWVILNLRNKELSETLKKIKKIVSDASVKNQIHVNEQIMKMILLFDPDGPIRIGTLSFFIDGLDSLYLDLMNQQSTEELRILSKFIELSMHLHWGDTRTNADFVAPDAIKQIQLKLDNIRLFARNVGYGFGFERILYELNPSLPCRSALCEKKHLTTLPALLTHLDAIAATSFRTQEAIDLHLAAFIASRISIIHEIKLHQLIPHPSLATDKNSMALHIISLAQSRCTNLQCPGLAHWLTFRVLPVLDIIRSRSLRSKVKQVAVQTAKSGYTQNIAEIVIHSNYAVADMSGFVKAIQTYKDNIKKIAFYQKDEVIDSYTQSVGYVIAKSIAYLSFTVIFIHLWIE